MRIEEHDLNPHVRRPSRNLALLSCIALVALAAGQIFAEEDWVTVRPQDTGEALVNPGMGWTLHFYSNFIENYGSKLEPADTLEDWPGLSVIYLHIDLHLRHFKQTLLCISDDVTGPTKPGRHFPAMEYALSKGITMRDDSILVQPPPHSWYTVALRHVASSGNHVPPVKPGDYDLFVSVGQRDGTPKLALPLPQADGLRRYKVGQISLR